MSSAKDARTSGLSGVWVACVILVLGLVMGWGTWSRYAREHPATSDAWIISEKQAEVYLPPEHVDLVKPGMRGFVSLPDSIERVMGRVDGVRIENGKTIVSLTLVSSIPVQWHGQSVEAVIDTLRPFEETSP